MRPREAARVASMKIKPVCSGDTAATLVALGFVLMLALFAFPADAAGPPRAPGHYPAIGDHVRALPPGSRTIKVGRQDYRYHNGSFYAPGPAGAYVVVRAPIGAQVSVLAPGYVSFSIGAGQFFFANYTFYAWNEDRTGYVVVEKPPGAEAAIAATEAASTAEIYVYPNKEQSTEQQGRDRYECYLWAVEKSGFDPVAGEPDAARSSDYQRAIAACLEGRGYTVR